MKTIVIEKEINSSKLYDELLNTGLITETQSNGTSRLQGESLFIEDTDDISAIQVIIDTHSPTPLPPTKTKLEILQETVDMLVLDNLEVF